MLPKCHLFSLLTLFFVIRSIMFQISDITFLVFVKHLMHLPFSNNSISTHTIQYALLKSYISAHIILCALLKSYISAHTIQCALLKSYISAHTTQCALLKSYISAHTIVKILHFSPHHPISCIDLKFSPPKDSHPSHLSSLEFVSIHVILNTCPFYIYCITVMKICRIILVNVQI